MTEARGRVRTALAAISLVALGAVGGITVDRLMHRAHEPSRTVVVEGDTVRLSDIHDDPVGVLDRAVHLRPEQRQKITAIMTQHQRNVDALWSDSRHRLQASMDSVLREVSAALDPDQRARFIRLVHQIHGNPPNMVDLPR
jgi:hypothetical protein